ncbi:MULTISPECIES: BON domain-containing protein [unclassified Caballeronia]|uniref:BON domain-containing protein n=1 Tax=unclassified Caballeronia TaxID=2646786 RepID=UPI001F3265E8|nr:MULTISPECIES: BON domain-containing protein [unclassified Caballeronia]MCE4541805.1 BON domain-containing protein [Caballeronia sp. PC1]MCE4569151.1 BON domain-containing protein [Caballeronia sp. CLC5]
MSTMTMRAAEAAAPGPIMFPKGHLATEGSPQSDNALFVEAINALRRDPLLASEAVLVDVRDARVTLRGIVASYARKVAACELIRGLPGVAAASDCLVVELLPDARRTDAELTSDVRSSLKWEACLPADAIDVEVGLAVSH